MSSARLVILSFLTVTSFAQTVKQKSVEKNEDTDPLDAYNDIIPLTGFEWRDSEPIKIRPFKPKYHLTMGTFPRTGG